MKSQNRHLKLKLAILCGVILLAAGGIGAYFALRSHDTEAEPAKPPVFSYDADKAPGWYRSPLDTAVKESRRSLLVFDYDIKAPQKQDNAQSCHVSAFLNQGTVDIDAKRKMAEVVSTDGRKTSLVDTLNLSLEKTLGSEKYTLYRYNSTGGAEKYKNGTAFGYIQAGEHYVEIQIICDTFEMLNSATNVLKAIRYNDTVSKNDLF